MRINYPEVRSPQALGIAREMSISRGLLGEPNVRGLGLGLAAPSPSAMLRAGRGFGKLGLGFRHADAAIFVIFVFSNGC